MMTLQNKRGVSLVTVLLFMLVATIAATATYRWLTSEGRSSAARLQKSVAYQSSQAGIESVRSWMTYHASDVGGLIKQFKDGNNEPILLNSQLKELSRAGQEYNVWLVGANTEHSTYKIKILSSGKGPNGAVYNQVAIFNVDGLYQVSLTSKKNVIDVDFDFAYFGGSYLGAGDVTISSAVVNGNWKGNPQNVTNNFIVTGNADLSGNKVNVGKLACIGGNMNIGNQGMEAKDLYVGGTAGDRITASGDVYFDGDVNQGQTGPIDIAGSVSLYGTMKTNQSTGNYYVKIGKNLCVDEKPGKAGKVLIGGDVGSFEVTENVFVKPSQGIIRGNEVCSTCELIQNDYTAGTQTVIGTIPCDQWPSENGQSKGKPIPSSCKINVQDNAGSYDKIVLGASSGSKVFIKGVKKASQYNTELAKTYDVSGKKYCPEDKRFKIRGSMNWAGPAANGHYTKYQDNLLDLNVCGTLSGTTSYRASAEKCTAYYFWGGCSRVETKNFEAIDYTRGWQDWNSSEKVQLFTSIENAANKYVVYENADFRFEKNKKLEDWRQFNIPTSGSPSQDGTKTPIWAPDWNVGFDDHFKSNVIVGAFVFGTGPGEKLYYNTTDNTNNFLNYENGQPTGSPYCYNDGSAEGKYRPTCRVTPWFKSEASGTNVKAGVGPAEKGQVICAESVKEACDNFWGTSTSGCDGSSHIVEDLLVTAYDKFIDYADKGCAASIKNWNSGLVAKLNECYRENINDETKKNENLYNGYLVVKVDGAQGTHNCPAGQLEGNYIIVANDNPIDCQNGLPPVKDGFRTFLFLEKGADNIGGATTKNYFIYTKDQIKSAKQLNLFGSIYAEAASCAGMGDMQSSTLTYDPTLVSDLVQAGIICEAKNGSSCGGIGGSGTGSGDPADPGAGTPGSTVTIETKDAYFVSNAPTLSVSLETQYKSDEALPIAENSPPAAGDFVVVPRVIYLTTDPYGELKDYYNVLGLNGLHLTKDDGSVSCEGPSGIKTSGKLYDRSGSDSKLPEGEFKCGFTYGGKEVPFYVNVGGESGYTPSVRFTEAQQEMGSNSSYEVKISVPAHTSPLKVQIIRPGDIDGWTITAASSGTCDANKCEFTLPANLQSTETTVFNVTTGGASSGTAMFQLTNGDGYIIGSPGTLVLSFTTTVTINRVDASLDDINDFCTANSAKCPGNKSTWPNCSYSGSDSWVKAAGCETRTANSKWSCGLESDIILEKANEVPECVAVIPQRTLEKTTVQAGETYDMPASLKAKPMKFQIGFKGNGSDLSGKTIIATISNPSNANRDGQTERCSYNSSSTAEELCVIEVFNGEKISLGFDFERPETFNYWSCEGASCPVTTTSATTFNEITIADNSSKAYAHFGENDKHCFFDEFNAGVGCDDNRYCLTESSEKWAVLTSGFESKLDYQNGYVSVKPSKSDKSGVTVLSNVTPGISGTLKAQFQVPQVPSGSTASTTTTIKNSGFILRSNANASDYLLLSLYIDNRGYLMAMLCTSDGATCTDARLESGGAGLAIATSTIVTLSVDVSPNSLELSAITGRLGASTVYSGTISLTEILENYTNAGSNIGFRIADPGFKLYDIGWRSETYGSECWDTYPTVNCSFKSAYIGGVVPLNRDAKPWVGLSSWFDARNCTPAYFYKGDDVIGCSGYDYRECSGGYNFSEKGAHGYTDAYNNEIRTAKAGVGNCYALGDDKDRLLAESERAHCGEFWVGELSYCKENVQFATTSKTIYSGSPESFNLEPREFRNLREATLKVELENSDNVLVEIYLLSKADEYAAIYHSKSYETTSTGLVEINVESILDADGFDPEHVYGVTVAVRGGYSPVTVKQIYTACPNVVSLGCDERISYDATSKKWSLSANMTNFAMAKSFIITEKNSFTSSRTFDCTADQCSYVESGKTAKFAFNIEDNPYTSNTGKDYQFKVSMSTLDGTNFECYTGMLNIPTIDRTCGGLSTSSVKMGAGIPAFSYAVSNCPSTGCTYKISLVGPESVDILSGNGNELNGQTGSSRANGSEKPLAAGTYKFKLESTDDEVPFESCESAEFTVRSAAADYEVECGVSKFNNSISGGTEFYTTDNLYFVSKLLDSEDNEVSLKVLVDESNIGSVTINKYGYSEAKNIGTLSKGTYKYSLTYANEEVCSSSITIKDAGDEVEASCASVTVYPNQSTGSLITMSGLENVNSSTRVIRIDGSEKTRSTNCNKYSCEDMMFNAPSATGSYEYKLYFNDTEKCSGTVTVNSTLACSVDKTDLKLGESFTFNVDYKGSCWSASLVGENVNRGDCQTSYSITPTTIGNDKEYTFKVTNGSLGAAECSPIKVNVSEEAPTASCPDYPIYLTPGSDASFTPTSVTRCSAIGCNYTIKKNGVTKVSVSDNSYKGGATKNYAYESGEYTFEVTNSAGSSTPCNFEVAYRSPSVNCSGTYNIEPTETVTFSPTVEYCTNCAYTITQGGTTIESGTYNGGNVTFTSEAEKGSKSYVFTVTNSAGQSDNCSVEVTYKTPSVECPTEAYSVEPGTNVNFTPASLSNCSKGCDYKLEYVSTSETKASTTNKSYTSASAVQFTRGTGLLSSLYKFTVTNRGGASDDCTFYVNDAKPTFTCPAGKTVSTGTNVAIEPTNIQNCTQGCDYKVSGGSANLNKTGNTTSGGSYNIGNVSESVSSDQTFYYTVTISNDAGTNETPCEVSVTYKITPVATACIAWVNGTGNYSENCYKSGLKNMNGKCYKCNPDRGNDCNGQWLNDDASQSYWWVETPCDGTGMTGGGSGGGDSGGGSGSTSVSTEAVEFTPGTYTITCSGGGQLICWNPNGGEFEFTFDGSPCKAYGGEGWGSCGGGTCSSSQKTLTTSKTVRCKGGW